MDLNEKYLDKLLEFIDDKVGEKFAILTAEEVLKDTELSLSQEEFFKGFNALQNNGVIRLKYNDGKTFCCAVTPKGKDLLEKINLPATDVVKNNDKKPYFLIFISAFLGGVLGGIIALIIAFIFVY